MFNIIFLANFVNAVFLIRLEVFFGQLDTYEEILQEHHIECARRICFGTGHQSVK
jgi:hypothetical protein